MCMCPWVRGDRGEGVRECKSERGLWYALSLSLTSSCALRSSQSVHPSLVYWQPAEFPCGWHKTTHMEKGSNLRRKKINYHGSSHHQCGFLVRVTVYYSTDAIVEREVKFEVWACMLVTQDYPPQANRTMALIYTAKELSCQLLSWGKLYKWTSLQELQCWCVFRS